MRYFAVKCCISRCVVDLRLAFNILLQAVPQPLLNWLRSFQPFLLSYLTSFPSQAPTSMRSVTQSLNLFTNALGSFSVIPLLLIVNSDSSK